MPCDAVHWVIEDNDHAFWLFMPCGLVRIARSEIDAWAAEVDHDGNTKRTIQAFVLDNSDGVTSQAIPYYYRPQVTESLDGKLWFVNLDGVSAYDPRHLPFNKVPPPVHIEQITADRKTYDPASYKNGYLSLPARVRDLAIDYTALSFVASEKVHFRFKLQGQDADWREVINSRHVEYSNLAPKRYRFMVKASNNSGVWNEEGAFLDFSVAPAFYQTLWFRLLCVAAFLALVWALYQLRLRELHREFHTALDARVNERTRIARELHDTLLQNFQAVLLFLHAASTEFEARPNAAQLTLDRAIAAAEDAVTEGRNAIQGLRASTTESNSLAAALRALGEGLASDRAHQNCPAVDVRVEGATRDLHPILRDDVLRIAGEALRNSFLHARASRIEVDIRYGNDLFRVRIRDDGKGIEQQIITDKGREGHWGLHGMRERAKIIGGNLEVGSSAEFGTEVKLTIPAWSAYATVGQRRARFSRKRSIAES